MSITIRGFDVPIINNGYREPLRIPEHCPPSTLRLAGRRSARTQGPRRESPSRSTSNGIKRESQPNHLRGTSLSDAADFIIRSPNRESCWRSIALFGVNTASYKFALAEALMRSKDRESDLLGLEELAVPFSSAICRHLLSSTKQGTMPRSKFLDACRRFNEGELTQQGLVDATVRDGFGDVLDAFHIVSGADVPKRFFVAERKPSGAIRLTEDFFELSVSSHSSSLACEVEARWRLVETAWRVGLNHRLIDVDSGGGDLQLMATDESGRRLSVTHARHALNGYQKGVCFYCSSPLNVAGAKSSSVEVDHFLPHTLMNRGRSMNLNGVWNLVNACRDCNRGPQGKFARPPVDRYLTNLHRRNEYYISSHHPLRETIIAQTGQTEPARRTYLRDQYQSAIDALIHTWEPASEGESAL